VLRDSRSDGGPFENQYRIDGQPSGRVNRLGESSESEQFVLVSDGHQGPCDLRQLLKSHVFNRWFLGHVAIVL
jgi:hypothetical protein